jgi:molybdenum ABC transporter molybdate-binding protein
MITENRAHRSTEPGGGRIGAVRVPAASRGAGGGRCPLVAAASDLRFALDELAQVFARESGTPVRIVYGSSGNFRRQIAEGGPFELFLSADEAYVIALAKEGRTIDEGVLYAIGRIALVLPIGSPLTLDPGLRDLAAAATDGRCASSRSRIRHAPYGRAAQEVDHRRRLGCGSTQSRLRRERFQAAHSRFPGRRRAARRVVARARVGALGNARLGISRRCIGRCGNGWS